MYNVSHQTNATTAPPALFVRKSPPLVPFVSCTKCATCSGQQRLMSRLIAAEGAGLATTRVVISMCHFSDFRRGFSECIY
jgi:hypothetical protein